MKKEQSVICTNRKAYHNYEISQTIEAGISLLGTEVKSVKEKRANISDSFAKIENRECFILNLHIAPYPQGNLHDPVRKRKLLLHKIQIDKFYRKTEEKGYTLIPTKVYLKNGRVKVEIGLARGKKLYDKREKLKKDIQQREIERALKRTDSNR